MKQSIEQRLRAIESKVSQKKRLKESGDISLEEYFEEGTTILPHRVKQWQNDDKYVDYIVEHQILFAPVGILEIHVFYEAEDFLENPTVGWPVIEEFKGRIKLSSSYGTAKENYIICKSADVDTSNAI